MSKGFRYAFNPITWAGIPNDFTGTSNLGLASNDATQRYICGTRNLTWDGSVYKYIKAGSTYTSYQLAVWHTATAAVVSYEALNAASTAGSMVVHIAQASLTEDQFAGGYITIYHATGDGQVYCIRGNTASSGGLVDLYLDRPLVKATTTSDNMELWANPYAEIDQGNAGGTHGFAGIPVALLTDTYFGWIRTWGPTFIAPQSTVGGAYLKEAYFRHDGSIDVRPAIATKDYVTDQRAGYVMAGSAAGDGPLLMLQVSV
jgi:hypothetical protein